MRKLIFILFLLIINFYLLYSRIFSAEIRNVKLQLRNDEIGLAIIHLENSTSILVQKEDVFIIYIWEYFGDPQLYETIKLFTNRVDYVFMREEYSVEFPHRMIVDGNVVIGGLHIRPNKIQYQNHLFCIDAYEGCDYIYLTREVEIGNNDNVRMILHNDNLSQDFIYKLRDRWADIYIVTKDEYTILILGRDYEIINLK